jgi:hypothetical protein
LRAAKDRGDASAAEDPYGGDGLLVVIHTDHDAGADDGEVSSHV